MADRSPKKGSPEAIADMNQSNRPASRHSKQAKWLRQHFSGIDLNRILQDSVEQRVERGEYVAAEARFNDLHEHFGLAQEARYQRFAAALNAARGAFRGNETVTQKTTGKQRSLRI